MITGTWSRCCFYMWKRLWNWKKDFVESGWKPWTASTCFRCLQETKARLLGVQRLELLESARTLLSAVPWSHGERSSWSGFLMGTLQIRMLEFASFLQLLQDADGDTGTIPGDTWTSISSPQIENQWQTKIRIPLKFQPGELMSFIGVAYRNMGEGLLTGTEMA